MMNDDIPDMMIMPPMMIMIEFCTERSSLLDFIIRTLP